LQAAVTFFVSRHYPLLFFSSLLQFFSKNKNSHITVIDLKTMSKNDVQRQLQSSFLGLQTIFWLGSFAQLSKGEQQVWLDYLSTYAGPHCIMICIEPSDVIQKQGVCYIEIPEAISFDIFLSIVLLTIQTVDREKLHTFFKKTIEITGSLTVDNACLLQYYFLVSGRNDEQFCKELLPLIVPPVHSLFTLSDAFFEKNSKKFTVLWSSLSSQFSIQFWISFWSEQLWRAYFYLVCMQSGRIADAKKVAYRLPFSFTQKSWKRYSLEPFVKGHAYLYELDYACKNGAVGQEAMLDLFCFNFLSH
jgi:hypothetical protein